MTKEFYQPVKKTVITKTPPNKVVPPKRPDESPSPQKKLEDGSNANDPNKKDASTDKSKANSDKKNDNGGSQLGIFSWLWRYFPKKKT
ncbi:conserved Plasmodium protein, unknown function [Plasmodium vinckei vinckei]|uniref:Uncharacterized protein n=1 Tax=Plasmodium vinckei vinckei TaxID=54757 RepID=A0A449BQG9_PLAVN|nr:conserved Plasmodium protein, unknown function [Plasmodium vinckei vinckei]VEV55716.1 conserved Plasmodium protein, unknown function [Plasmodium vinckei vinckei]